MDFRFLNPTSRLPDRSVTRTIFLKLIALLGFSAFLSLHLQLMGLVGENGILPFVSGLETVLSEKGWLETFSQYPTLLVFYNSNFMLGFIGYLGMGASLVLLLGFIPRIALFFMWLFYLSMVTAGQNFTTFQWDILILETFFYAIFLAPGIWHPGNKKNPPSSISVFLFNLLLFKLMFLGGIAKLAGGDSTWWSLTALNYHFETQPLPNPVAWYVHNLPEFILEWGTVFTLVVEIVVPFFLFCPRILRIFGVYLLASLQILIMITGNYGPFNIHALILCFLQLDDKHLQYLLSGISLDIKGESTENAGKIGWVSVTGSVLLITFNLIYFVSVLGGSQILPRPARKSIQYMNRFRTINTYGLFADMTTVRREIIIQGSNDGKNWKSYRFPYKPGELDRRPPVIFPHMPRLDWQMWFAALKPVRRVRWFPRLMKQLLRGSDRVQELFEKNPFVNSPPQFMRAVIYRYKFTSPEKGYETGRWWTRSKGKLYAPPVTLQNGKLIQVQ